MKTLLRNLMIPFYRLSKVFSRENLYTWLADDLASLPAQSNVLCVGGGGALDTMIKDAPSASCISIDIDPDRKPDMVMDVTALTFEDSTFDAVYMMEVLEHVNEPVAALAEIERVLKPGGRFVMSTPFVFGIHEAPYDFWRFTRHGLDHLLAKFSDRNIRARNGYYSAAVVIFMRAVFSQTRAQRLIGAAIIVLGLPAFLLLLLLDRLSPNEDATTGYFVTCNKT